MRASARLIEEVATVSLAMREPEENCCAAIANRPAFFTKKPSRRMTADDFLL
jgi:hypothetical protein